MNGPTEVSPALPPAGWHPDPYGSGLRWWDGATWTHHVSPAQHQAPLPASAPSSGRTPSGRQLLIGGAALIAVVAAIAILVGGGGDSSSPENPEAGAAASASPGTANPLPLEPPAESPAEPSVVPPAAVGAPDEFAKERAHSAQVAIEAYATDHGESYVAATPQALIAIDPVLQDASFEVASTVHTYRIVVRSQTGAVFSVAKEADGGLVYACSPEGRRGCPPGGSW